MFISRKELEVLRSKILWLESENRYFQVRLGNQVSISVGAEQRIKYLEDYLDIELTCTPSKTQYKKTNPRNSVVKS